MPRYFFNTENGELVCDTRGEELPDEAAAKREAVRLLGAILHDQPDEFMQRDRWRLTVAEEGRGALFAVEVGLSSAPEITEWDVADKASARGERVGSERLTVSPAPRRPPS